MRQILHVSDLHHGRHYLPEIGEGLLGLIDERRPDLVVISGDLTLRAKSRQFQDARAWADRVSAPTLVVPGNHDVPMYRFWERLASPYGAYRKHFDDDLEPVYEDDSLLVVGINTAHGLTHKDGRIRVRRLHQVEALCAAAPPEKVRIIVAHHQLVPAPRYDNQRVLRNAREAVEVFQRAGVELVLSGHLHQAYVASSESYYPSGRRPVLLVHAGTTTSTRGRASERRRNSCNWIAIGPDRLTISHLGWDQERGRFVEWNRHLYPRRNRYPYALVGGDLD